MKEGLKLTCGAGCSVGRGAGEIRRMRHGRSAEGGLMSDIVGTKVASAREDRSGAGSSAGRVRRPA